MSQRRVKRFVWPIVVILIGFLNMCSNTAPCIAGEDHYRSFRKRDYDGSQNREYIVHVPTGYDQGTEQLPVVMVLHGCKQNHEAIKQIANFDVIADQEQFIVVYPFIAQYDGFRDRNCWGFWMDEHIHAGRGEVQDLAEMVEEVTANYRVDGNRIHIAGLSSGAGMAVAAMVAHCELFASGSPTAGLAYGETPSAVPRSCYWTGTFKSDDEVVAAMNREMADEKRPVPIFIIHSTGDCVVHVEAAENTRDTWGKAFGVDTANPVQTETGTTKGTRWTHKTYAAPAERTLIETLFVEGLDHGWYGGRPGQYSFPNAPNTAQLIWDFFEQHPLHPNGPPNVTIANVIPDNQQRSIQVSGTVTDDHVDTLNVKVEFLGLAPQTQRDAEVDVEAKTFSYQSNEGLPDNTYYRPRVIVRDADGASAQTTGDAVALGSPTTEPPKVAIDHARADLSRVTLGGTVFDDVGVVSVDVRFDDNNWSPAEINNGSWRFEGGGLAGGTHAFNVRAMDKEALDTIESGSVTVDLPYDAKQSSDITGHVIGSRIRVYPSGFGAADKTYYELFQEHGTFESFWLYRAKSTNNWYADISTIRHGTRDPFLGRIEEAAKRRPSTLNGPRVRQLLLELLEELEQERLESSDAGCSGCK